MTDELETLVAGSTVSVARPSGAITSDSFEGLYHRDVRLVSAFSLTADGAEPPLATAARNGAASADRIHQLSVDEHSSPTAVLRCRRTVGLAVREDWTVTVYEGTFSGELRLRLESDFADLLAQRHSLNAVPAVPYKTDGAALIADGERFGVQIEVEGPAPRVADDGFTWTVDTAPGRPWSAAVTFRPRDRGHLIGEPETVPVAPPQLRAATAATRWQAATASAVADLRGLRVTVPDLSLSYLGAGAPWFMALFGRDSLLTSWSSLVGGTALGLETLEALARFQGREHDERTLEQPGRILHELRTGGAAVFGLDPGRPYYGTVDASPLFVLLADELLRWGADRERVAALLPAARAALDWCVEYGDLDGDGYVEYAADPRGLGNQGWKDSGDAMVHADGSLAEAPIALAEVQAYLYGAYRALASLEERVGDPSRAPGLRARAAGLREAFRRDFWLPERSLVAMALDADKRPLAVASSNMGHTLWTGLLDDDIAARVADRLTAPDLLASWGLRTLGSGERTYNPLSYHRGSIWPHDSAIAAAGLMRYGHVAPALRVAEGLLAAAERFGWRLPELFGGLDAAEVPYPVPYPVACSPQAWSAAAPLLLLRTVLRLEPDVPAGRVNVAPVLPDDVELAVSLPLGGETLALRIKGGSCEVLACPEGIDVEGGHDGRAQR